MVSAYEIPNVWMVPLYPFHNKVSYKSTCRRIPLYLITEHLQGKARTEESFKQIRLDSEDAHTVIDCLAYAPAATTSVLDLCFQSFSGKDSVICFSAALHERGVCLSVHGLREGHKSGS